MPTRSLFDFSYELTNVNSTIGDPKVKRLPSQRNDWLSFSRLSRFLLQKLLEMLCLAKANYTANFSDSILRCGKPHSRVAKECSPKHFRPFSHDSGIRGYFASFGESFELIIVAFLRSIKKDSTWRYASYWFFSRTTTPRCCSFPTVATPPLLVNFPVEYLGLSRNLEVLISVHNSCWWRLL